MPHAANGEKLEEWRLDVEQGLDAFANQQLVALAVTLDVVGPAAAVDDGQLLVVLAQLGQHRFMVGAERRRGRDHLIGKDAHWA